MDLEWNDAQRERLHQEIVDHRPSDTPKVVAEDWFDEAVKAGPSNYAGDDDFALVRLAGPRASEFSRALGMAARQSINLVAHDVLLNPRLSEPEKVLEVATRLVHGLTYGAGVPEDVRESVVDLADRMTELGVYWTATIDAEAVHRSNAEIAVEEINAEADAHDAG